MKSNGNDFKAELTQLSMKAQFCLMSCKDKWGQYQCLLSNDQSFKRGHTYSIYQFPALLRVLGRKADLFTSTLQKELYDKENSVVAIVNWQGLEREFIHLKFSKRDEEYIIDFMANYKSELTEYVSDLKEEAKKGGLNCQ